MIGIEPRRGWRTIDVWVSMEPPLEARRLMKDVTLSFHSEALSDSSRAVRVPWTNAVRIVGAEDVFVVRMKVPAGADSLLHAVAVIDEPDAMERKPAVRRYIGFANVTLKADGLPKAVLEIRRFESYSLVVPGRAA